MIIGDNKFRIPFTYSFDMSLEDGIQMVVGCNFIRNMQGGLRIEGNLITIYKNVTSITTNEAAIHAIQELSMDEEEYLNIQEKVYYAMGLAPSNPKIFRRHEVLIEKLKNQGFIGDDPLKYWSRNLPGINTILKRVGNSKIYSKFDLKSGFHQIAMDPESVEWTTFISPSGLYEL